MMHKFLFQRIMVFAVLCCGIELCAVQVAVPTPRPYTTRLPANICGEVYQTVCDGVSAAGFSVMSESTSNELLATLETQDEVSRGAFLRERGIAGLLRTELNRGLGGFVLQVEPMGCQTDLGLPAESFAIQIGQYQNLRRCVAELSAMLTAGNAGSQTPLTALLPMRIQEPLAPLFLGNYLSGRLENALLRRGYRLCASGVLENALRMNNLGGFFELTKARCVNLGKSLQVATFIQVSIDTYQVYDDNDAGMRGKIAGVVREVSATNGELLQSVPIQLEITSNDGRLAGMVLQDVNAFGQAALDLLIQEQILPH
ncbi:MAG: hypothetical protein IKR13_04715, partial [Victivallales bacterium]|nr:hypothetical protein [Victivallales bacterium]